jgi:hypothetical protein
MQDCNRVHVIENSFVTLKHVPASSVAVFMARVGCGMHVICEQTGLITDDRDSRDWEVPLFLGRAVFYSIRSLLTSQRMSVCCLTFNWKYEPCIPRARGGVIGWAIMLQAGRSRVRYPMRSLDFLIVLILQPHNGPSLDSASNRNENQESSWG